MKSSTASPNLEDNICPICLYIFIQPVTMPCEHELCLECFKQNVEEANFCCPMCRIRISTWARRAAKTRSLVNEKRWKYIQQHFPEQVKSRIEGREEEDEEMKALNVSIKLAEPGEIRTEYELQLKQLQAQRQQERQKELEASEQLILKLQEEENKREEERKLMARQDEELARKLSQTDGESPGIEQRLRGSSCSSRGAASDGRQSESNCDSMEMFINKMRAENNMSKSPYPYRCLTPVGTGKMCVDKDKVKMMEEHYKRQKIKRDKNLITTQDIANLEEQFKLQRPRPKSNTCTETIEIDHLSRGCESNTSMGMRHLSTTNLNQNEILDQMSTGLDVSVSVIEPVLNNDVIIISPSPSPVVMETRSISRSRPSTKASSPTSTTSCSYKSAENEKQERSVSAQSSDSISQELTHFRPIRSCPLTPPRKLPSGKVVEPQLIRTTPRNLMKSGSWGQNETNLSDIDGGSPIMQRRLSELAEERKDKVVRLSKSTGTDSENRNPQPREDLAAVDPLIRRTPNSCRKDQFKDISNSPINTKRKLEIEENEDILSRKAKVLIPLIPDFDDNMEHDIPIIMPSPKTVQGNSSKDRLSKTRKGKSRKVSYSSSECIDKGGSPQVSILKWMNQNDGLRTCVKNEKQEYLIDSKRDEVDCEKRNDFETEDKTANEAHCSKDGEMLNRKHKRPRRIIKSSQKSDYVYESEGKSPRKCNESTVSSKKDGLCSDGDSETSDISPDKKKRKLDFNVEDNMMVTGKIKAKELLFKPKPVLKSVKQTKGQSKRNKGVNKKAINRPGKTMHDFFHSSVVPSKSSDLLCSEESQEIKDRKMAEELQRQFEMEAKFQLNSIRFKGSSDEYSFRQHRKSKSLFS